MVVDNRYFTLPRNIPKQFFPLDLKVSVLQDIGSGLSYLHERSPPVIHRDLSAKNVLLDKEMSAKIVDLGMARLAPQLLKKAAATMTKGPGASIYMPPEASAPAKSDPLKSKYDASIDIFSLGVITIFTISEVFLGNILPASFVNEDTGVVGGRSELQRRSEYMKIVEEQLHANGQIDKDHPLIRLIQKSLHNLPAKRPSINDVLRLLKEARVGMRDSEWREEQSHQSEQDLRSRVQDLQQQLHNKFQENVKLLESNTEKDKELKQRIADNQIVQERLREVEDRIRREQDQVETKEKELAKAKQQLKEKEEKLLSSQALVADFKKTPNFRDLLDTPTSKSENLEPSNSRKSSTVRPKKIQFSNLPSPHSKQPLLNPKKITLICQQKKKAPVGMVRGSAISGDKFAYFASFSSSSLYRYEYATEKWETLQECPYKDSGLTILNNELTTVGGQIGFVETNKLMTLRQTEWVEDFPPMKIGRSSPALVTTSNGNYLFAIGGRVGGCCAAVEVLLLSSRKWCTVISLPQPLSLPSATLTVGDELNVIGKDGDGFASSLQDLLSTDQPITSPIILTWTALPPLPVRCSTAASLSGQLLFIGGRQGWSSVNSIHQLVERQWLKIGSMYSQRERCLVVSPSPDKIMIIGGYGAEYSIEECTTA